MGAGQISYEPSDPVGGNGQAKGLDHTSPGQSPGFIAPQFMLQAEGLPQIVLPQPHSVIIMPQSRSQVIIHIVFRDYVPRFQRFAILSP